MGKAALAAGARPGKARTKVLIDATLDAVRDTYVEELVIAAPE
jgi:hypothetical protein